MNPENMTNGGKDTCRKQVRQISMKRAIKGSLSHIQDYGSSESEEEVPPAKSCKRLPTPTLPTYGECRSIVREPACKAGEQKIRNFPHEPGNWATYIYAPVSRTHDLLDFITDLSNLLSSLELNPTEDFHISVTRTVVLRHHWIKDFTNSVNEVVQNMKPFYINLSDFKVYLNENKTRTFIGLKVEEGSNEFKYIVDIMDKCLAHYNLPPFYKPPSFHVSILWCVGDKSKEINDHLKHLPDSLEGVNFYEKVSCLRCNCGNKTFNFSFSSESHKLAL